jgi:hypothetical protein
MFKKLFSYLKPIWSGNDEKPSLRSIGAAALIIDFIINVHNSASVVIKVLKLIYAQKAVDPALVSSLTGTLGQVVLILGLEVGLITALLAIKAYQSQAEASVTQTDPNT